MCRNQVKCWLMSEPFPGRFTRLVEAHKNSTHNRIESFNATWSECHALPQSQSTTRKPLRNSCGHQPTTVSCPPMCAFWIMPTSLAPSPMANVTSPCDLTRNVTYRGAYACHGQGARSLHGCQLHGGRCMFVSLWSLHVVSCMVAACLQAT